MFFDPFSPPPLPRDEHEARVVGVIFFVLWGLALLFLYWQSSRTVRSLKEEKSATLEGAEKSDSMTK